MRLIYDICLQRESYNRLRIRHATRHEVSQQKQEIEDKVVGPVASGALLSHFPTAIFCRFARPQAMLDGLRTDAALLETLMGFERGKASQRKAGSAQPDDTTIEALHSEVHHVSRQYVAPSFSRAPGMKGPSPLFSQPSVCAGSAASNFASPT
jgi:hypothetical protein